jgi:phosphatidylglycerophosphate synthase
VSSLLANPGPPPDTGALPAAAPILVLVPNSLASPCASGVAMAQDGNPKILGMGIACRTVRASRRTGYVHIFHLTPTNAAPSGATAIADWSGIEAAFGTSEAAPLLIVPATILAETGWLERLARTRVEPTAWAESPGHIIVLAPTAVREALATLDAEGGARGLAAVHDRLTRRFGPPAALPEGIDPMVVVAPADIRVAERRLLRALVKDTDGFMARNVERPISLAISRLLASTTVTPNQMTFISVAIGLAAAPFFLSALALWQTVGALLFLAHSILDGCDGELARLKFQESRAGGILDFWGDNVVHSVIFACMAAGWSRADGQAWPLLLGAAAVLGTLGSAGFVYWRVIHPKDDAGPLFTSVSTSPGRRLTLLLDALARRDFIYLVVAFALFGKANWFLLLTGLGAPTFFFLLVVIAAREQAAKTSTPSSA